MSLRVAVRRVIKLRGRRMLSVVGLALTALAGPVLLASAHPITVNGVSTDWLARAPMYENTGIVARDATEQGGDAWSDPAGGEGTNFASPDHRVDMAQVRYTAPSTTFFALV